MNNQKKELLHNEREALIAILKNRFDKNINRHKTLDWDKILAKLHDDKFAEKLWSINEMEKTGGEPDVVGYNSSTNEFIFADCSPESPIGRRNLCYDREALDARKEFKPVNSAIDLAKFMGIEMLTEEQYRDLQLLGKFDLKTSSWVKTPDAIRKLGGAIFCDRRYDHVFMYHNGAQSYYAVRGFRGQLKL